MTSDGKYNFNNVSETSNLVGLHSSFVKIRVWMSFGGWKTSFDFASTGAWRLHPTWWWSHLVIVSPMMVIVAPTCLKGLYIRPLVVNLAIFTSPWDLETLEWWVNLKLSLGYNLKACLTYIFMINNRFEVRIFYFQYLISWLLEKKPQLAWGNDFSPNKLCLHLVLDV